jgi:hypothetical protein
MIRKFPLAFASLLVGIVSFVQLFGLEKAVLAIILGALALKEVSPDQEKGKTYAYAGIALGSVYVLILVAIAVIKGPAIIQHISKLR